MNDPLKILGNSLITIGVVGLVLFFVLLITSRGVSQGVNNACWAQGYSESREIKGEPYCANPGEKAVKLSEID